MNTSKGENIKEGKLQGLIIGAGLALLGVCIALFEVFVPVFEVKGPLAFVIGLPLLWAGSTMIYRATHLRAADVFKLAKELHDHITPQWVITTFDCNPSQAAKILNELLKSRLIQRPAGVSPDEMIFEVRLDEDPLAGALARQKPGRGRR